MAADRKPLRDFIYLDWERVRSLAAQLLEGVPEEASRGRQHEVGGTGRVEGGLPLLLKGQAEADYRFFRTASETRSLHHHVYTLVEEHLMRDGRVLQVGPDFDHSLWAEDLFPDGRFVLVEGTVRLMEYGWLSTMMENLPAMMKAAQHGESLGWNEALRTGSLTAQEVETRRREQQRQLTELKQLKIPEVTGLVRQLYGEVVRVKVLPERGYPEHIVIATAEPENFQGSTLSLIQKFGYEINAGWRLFGQVNGNSESGEALLPLPIGNTMEDTFEGLAIVMDELMQIASGASFPVVSVTPISLYRIAA